MQYLAMGGVRKRGWACIARKMMVSLPMPWHNLTGTICLP